EGGRWGRGMRHPTPDSRLSTPELPIAVDQVSEAERAIEDRSLFLAPTAHLWGGAVNAIGHAAERQRLQPHFSRTGERREEDALAAKERRLYFADELDVVGDAWLQRDETTGVNAQRLSNAELEVVDGAGRVDEQ